MWKIIQTEEFEEWYSHLDISAQENIFEKMEILKEFGPALGRPLVDTVNASKHKNMKELRIQSKGRPFRIFFAFDKKRQALLLIGGNKSNNKRFYKTMIPWADDLLSEYLKQKT